MIKNMKENNENTELMELCNMHKKAVYRTLEVMLATTAISLLLIKDSIMLEEAQWILAADVLGVAVCIGLQLKWQHRVLEGLIEAGCLAFLICPKWWIMLACFLMWLILLLRTSPAQIQHEPGDNGPEIT